MPELYVRTPMQKSDWLTPNWTSPRGMIDAVHHIGCVQGTNPGVNNADKLSTALAEYGHKYDIVLPGGDIYITEPIEWPQQLGGRLLGQGCSRDIGDGHYTSSGLVRGQVTRIVSEFEDEGGDGVSTINAMLRYRGHSGVIAGIHFQGKPVDGFGTEPTDDSDPKARVGIHVIANSDSSNTGKLAVRDCSFFQCHNGMLLGYDLTAADDTGAFTGSNYLHADDVVIDNCAFYHPWRDCRFTDGTIEVVDGVVTLSDTAEVWPDWADRNAMIRVEGTYHEKYYYVASRDSDTQLTLDDTSVNIAASTTYKLDQESTSVRVRCDQAVEFHWTKIGHWGYGNECFWMERGGRMHATTVGCFGGKCTLLRIGYPQVSYNRYVIDSFDIDRTSTYPFELLFMDYMTFPPSYIKLGGHIGGSNEDIDFTAVTARGSATVVLEGLTGYRGLLDDTILLRGAGGYTCKCHLTDCMVDVTDPTDLLHASSTTPYNLQWRGCNERNNGANWGIPIADDEVSA